jgi:hypothetical protein
MNRGKIRLREVNAKFRHLKQGGYSVLLQTIYCRSFTLYIYPESEPAKLLDQPHSKTLEGMGPQAEQPLPQSPFTGKFV